MKSIISLTTMSLKRFKTKVKTPLDPDGLLLPKRNMMGRNKKPRPELLLVVSKKC